MSERRKRRSFGPVYRKLTRCGREFSIVAKMVLLNLLERADAAAGAESETVFPGQVRIANDIGADPHAVRRALKELEAAELLTSTRRGWSQTNIYTINYLALDSWVRTADYAVQESPEDTAGESADSAVHDARITPFSEEDSAVQESADSADKVPPLEGPPPEVPPLKGRQLETKALRFSRRFNRPDAADFEDEPKSRYEFILEHLAPRLRTSPLNTDWAAQTANLFDLMQIEEAEEWLEANGHFNWPQNVYAVCLFTAQNGEPGGVSDLIPDPPGKYEHRCIENRHVVWRNRPENSPCPSCGSVLLPTGEFDPTPQNGYCPAKGCRRVVTAPAFNCKVHGAVQPVPSKAAAS